MAGFQQFADSRHANPVQGFYATHILTWATGGHHKDVSWDIQVRKAGEETEAQRATLTSKIFTLNMVCLGKTVFMTYI